MIFQFRVQLTGKSNIIEREKKKRFFPVKVEIYSFHNDLLESFSLESFQFKVNLREKFSFYYILLYIDNIQLFALFRDKDYSRDGKYILLDERVTVANIFTLTQLLTVHGEKINLKANKRDLRIAYQMKNNFISTFGSISKVISTSPNGLETNSYRMFNFLSNLVFHNLIDLNVFTEFLILTRSCTFIQGLWNLSQHPFRQVKPIYQLISERKQLYRPSLPGLIFEKSLLSHKNSCNFPDWNFSSCPNQWTLTLKFNCTGATNFIFGGPGNLVFDKYDQVWINNNVRQGTPNSSTFVTVLKSNGQPTSFSPLFGGGLLGAGFGAAINKKGDEIAIGNFGWGSIDYNPQFGSISLISARGFLKTPSRGFTNKIHRVQGLTYDHQGNLWMTSWGSQNPLAPSPGSTFNFKSFNSGIVVYLRGNPQKALKYEFEDPDFQPFDVATDSQNNIYVSNSGSQQINGKNVNSSVFKFRLVRSDKSHHKYQIKMLAKWESAEVENFRQVEVNSKGEIYVAAVRTSRILKFDSQLNLIKTFQKKINGPWGITFDEKDRMYVANFARETERISQDSFDMRGPFGVTIVRKDNQKTAKFMTLPTGGKPVTLANGFPLYGSGSLKSFQPLMRLTATGIDRIGNLWAINNWKPALIQDIRGNPGGDGVVVFIGIAVPKEN